MIDWNLSSILQLRSSILHLQSSIIDPLFSNQHPPTSTSSESQLVVVNEETNVRI